MNIRYDLSDVFEVLFKSVFFGEIDIVLIWYDPADRLVVGYELRTPVLTGSPQPQQQSQRQGRRETMEPCEG